MASAFALGGIAGRSDVVGTHCSTCRAKSTERAMARPPRAHLLAFPQIQYRNGQSVTHGELDEPAGKVMRTLPRSGGKVAGAESRTQTATV
jgi:hypothetical protein